MGPRRCIYTGTEAGSTDNVMPKKTDENTLHNWTNRAPASAEYQENKKNRLPSDLEMEANRIFHLLELSRLDVSLYEARLREIQDLLAGKKAEEIDKAYHIKDLTDGFESGVETLLATEKKKLWE